MTLEGKGALVTGATSGIGEAVALRLAGQGADLLVSGRDSGRGEELARRLADAGAGRSRFVKADLSVAGEALQLAAAAESWLDGVDVLVNNAATGGAGPSTDIPIEDWEAVFALNVRAPYLLSTAVMTKMSERRHGVVVNVTSSVAYRGWPGYAAYASSKAALDAMTRCWSATYGLWGVRVNAVSPGPVLTPGTLRDSTPEDIAQFCSTFGLGRYGEPEEVAAAVAFLAGPQADYIHGTTLHVDGGMLETFGYQPISVRDVAGEASRRPSALPESRRRLFPRFRP
ncbi:MAG TPA: SDR family oxidoreductase [Actinomycetota bacterium]|nr:SDR family oxidoreductase [Actinomycetota bacterium]